MILKTQFPTNLLIRLRCFKSQVHTIVMNTNGQFILKDHDRTSCRRNKAFGELGGKPFGCFRFLARWRDAIKTGSDGGFRKDVLALLRSCQRRRREREKRRELEQAFPGMHTPFLKRPGPIAKLINRLLITRLGLPSGVEWIEISDDYELGLTPHVCQRANEDRERISPDWINKYYRSNQAISDGRLIVNGYSELGPTRDQKTGAVIGLSYHGLFGW